MHLRNAVPCLLLALLGAVACSSGQTTITGAPGANEDGGTTEAGSVDPILPTPPGDGGASCEPACSGNQVCNAGRCVDLPSTCPCPPESYCELATNSCKVGCTADDGCNKGRFCDTASRTCKAGCRADTDCPLSDTCQNHVCANSCGTCNDGNPCTTDSCQRSVCVHAAGNENGACADDGNPCTTDVCKSGQCAHPAGNNGVACTKGTCVTGAACSAGACVGTNKPDTTSCGATAFDQCLGGTCAKASALCETKNAVNDNYIYSEWREVGGATGNQTYYSCQTINPTSMRVDWPPGVVGSGGTPRSWICGSGVRAAPTNSRSLSCFP